MSSELYRVLHILGVFMVLAGLAGLWGMYASGEPTKSHRRAMALTHGLGLLLVVVTGFGRLAQLGYREHLPGWAIAKGLIWLVLGGTLMLARRRASWALPFWLLLGAVAAYLALFKPF